MHTNSLSTASVVTRTERSGCVEKRTTSDVFHAGYLAYPSPARGTYKTANDTRHDMRANQNSTTAFAAGNSMRRLLSRPAGSGRTASPCLAESIVSSEPRTLKLLNT